MRAHAQLKVKSHVGRDVLASAASFKTEAAVVWEYVVNSIQYVDPGVSPKVHVCINSIKKRIMISDNGAGMSVAELEHFFQMHGENLKRRAGRAGRGKFGTGKSAAFGIANELRVDTIRHGKQNAVILTRAMINASDGEEIPLEWLIRDEKIDEPNGTTITIGDINLDRIKKASIIEYVERHLQAFWARTPDIAIDDHLCAYREPATSEVLQFQPSEIQRRLLGDVTLTVRVAAAPIPAAEQGISITSGLGNLVAIERAGIDGKEFGNYLFGEIDVPALETYSSPIEPFDPTRSMQLNPQHPVVATLLGFIGSKLEEVRATLFAAQRRRGKRSKRVGLLWKLTRSRKF